MIKYEIIYVYLILDNVYMIYYINLNNVKLFVWVSLWNVFIYLYYFFLGLVSICICMDWNFKDIRKKMC